MDWVYYRGCIWGFAKYALTDLIFDLKSHMLKSLSSKAKQNNIELVFMFVRGCLFILFIMLQIKEVIIFIFNDIIEFSYP